MIQFQFYRGYLIALSDITNDSVEIQMEELSPELYQVPLTTITDALEELTRASIARAEEMLAATSS